MAIKNITWSPSEKHSSAILSNNNLTVEVAWKQSARATIGKTTGKWYWEVKVDKVPSTNTPSIGVVSGSVDVSQLISTGSNTGTRSYSGQDGKKYPDGVFYGETYTVNDVISVLLDMDNGTLEFWKNGVSQGVSHTDILSLGEVFAFVNNGSGNSDTAIYTANFGLTAFVYSLPSEYQPYGWVDVNKILISSESGEVESVVEGGYTENLIPVMTSNTSPSGVASASSVYSTSYDAWNAFDESIVGFNGWVANGVSNQWIQYEFLSEKTVEKYAIQAREDVYENTTSVWEFLASNDGINFTLLDSITVSGWTPKEIKEFNINNNTPYKFYRLLGIDNTGGGDISIGRLMLYDYIKPTIKSLPSQTEQDFINHGMDSLSTLNPTVEYTKKQYIQNQSTVLGNGKTFEQPIDMNKYKIKKIVVE
jgi:hypothetical protein